jgi:hypothetical protein
MNGESACLGAAMDPIPSHGTAAANSELIPPASELSSAGAKGEEQEIQPFF